MARKTPPSFPFYAEDFLAGTTRLSLAAKGAYIDCLCYQWHADEALPADDMKELAKIMRCTVAEARTVWPRIASKFAPVDGGVRNLRLEEERASKQRYHDAQTHNGKLGGRPKKEKPTGSETETHGLSKTEPTGFVPYPYPYPSAPTVQRDARAPEPPGRARRPDPYAHAVVQAPNGRAFWEGPIFSIPNEWARKTLAAANGKAAGSTIVLFAKALTERLQREGGEAPTKGFLGWLDTEWTAYRQPSSPSPYAPAEAVIAEMRAVSASIAAEAGTPESRRAIVREVLGRRPA